MKIRTITISDYDKMVLKALEASGSARGCRNKEKAYSETMIREFAKSEVCDMDALKFSIHGISLIHYKKENLGTNRWGDWYKRIYVEPLELDPLVHETPCYLVTMSGKKYSKDHILGVLSNETICCLFRY